MLVFSLGWWSTRILTGLLGPHDTWDTSRATIHFTYGAITHYGHSSQSVQLCIVVSHRGPATPANKLAGLGSTRFARHYSGYLLLDFFSWRYWDVSIPSVCFLTLLHSDKDYRMLLLQGFPIRTCTGQTLSWQLTVLFRGLNRPSSPACPKASISRPESLITHEFWKKRITSLFPTLRLFADLWNLIHVNLTFVSPTYLKLFRVRYIFIWSCSWFFLRELLTRF